jgi:hypothetical protein
MPDNMLFIAGVLPASLCCVAGGLIAFGNRMLVRIAVAVSYGGTLAQWPRGVRRDRPGHRRSHTPSECRARYCPIRVDASHRRWSTPRTPRARERQPICSSSKNSGMLQAGARLYLACAAAVVEDIQQAPRVREHITSTFLLVLNGFVLVLGTTLEICSAYGRRFRSRSSGRGVSAVVWSDPISTATTGSRRPAPPPCCRAGRRSAWRR